MCLNTAAFLEHPLATQGENVVDAISRFCERKRGVENLNMLAG